MYRWNGIFLEVEFFNLFFEFGIKWKNLVCVLGIFEVNIEVVDEENCKVVEKCYNVLLLWK